MRRLGWFLLVVSGCAIPVRDNPHDSAIVPVAKLRLVDLGATCPGDPSTAAGTDVTGPVSRGRCLALDARASSDPRNQGLDYEYSWRTSGDVPWQLLEDEGLEVYVLPSVFKLARTPAEPIEMRVKVSNGQGSSISDPTVSLVLTNAKPVANAGAPQTRPLGGYSWSGSAPTFTVTLDGSGSSDPDGDELTYCWTTDAVGVPALPCDVIEPTVSFALDVAVPLEARIELTVSDGNAVSLRSKTTVSVTSTPAVWFQSTSFTRVERLDGADFDAIFNGEPYAKPISATEVAMSSLFIGVRQISRAPKVSPSGDSVRIPIGLPNPSALFLEADAANDRAWVLYNSNGGPTPCAAAASGATLLGVAGPTYATRVCVRLPWTTSPNFFRFSSLAIDAQGMAWIANPLTTEVLVVDPADGSSITLDDGLLIADLEMDPSSGAVWQLRTPSLIGEGSGTIGAPRIVRDPGAPAEDILLPVQEAYRMAFVNDELLWLSTDEGVFLLDLTVLAPGGAFDEATLASFPLTSIFDLEADSTTADAWAYATVEAESYRLSQRGGATRISSRRVSRMFTESGTGETWYRVMPEVPTVLLRRGNTVSDEATVADTALVAIRGGAAVDAANGALWMSRSIPSALVRIAADGDIDRSETTVLRGGSPELVSPYVLLRAEPGTPYLWGIDYDLGTGTIASLDRLDVVQSPPVVTRILDASQVAPLGSASVFAPSSAAASAPFAWVALASPVSVATVATGGVITTRFVVPGAESIQYSARVESTNELCLVTLNGATLTVRWILPGGGVGATSTQSFAGLTTVRGVSVTDRFETSDFGDTCFVVASDDTGPDSVVFGFRRDFPQASANLSDFEVSGTITSIHAVNDIDLWYSLDKTDGTTVKVRRRLGQSRREFLASEAGTFVGPANGNSNQLP